MWSHYADSHKGVCLTFNVNEEFTKPCHREKLFAVIYRDAPVQLDWGGAKLEDFFVHKDKRWEYEREYRCMIPLRSLEGYCDDSFDENNVYAGKPLLRTLPANTIVGVTIGCYFRQNGLKERTRFQEILNEKATNTSLEAAYENIDKGVLGFEPISNV
jgi:hypothetical protein